jgi:hypothetical protein
MTLQLVRTVGRVVVSLVLVGVVSCGSESTGLTNVEVSNETDTFQFQATANDNTETLSYIWVNTGTRADVNQSGSITGGTATLEIRDGDGAQVYVRSLAETGTFETDAGAAGNWTIRVSMVGTSGVLNFRVEKP